MDTKSIVMLLIAFLQRVISGLDTFNCDFQTSFCGLVQDQADNFDWRRHSGKTNSYNTGPDMDNTLGTNEGYYIYIETTLRSPNDIARLVGPYMDCYTSTISFSYHMYGTGINKLVLYVVGYDGQNKATWSQSGDKGNEWYATTLQITSDVKWKIVIEGHRGANYLGDIAMDDLDIVCTGLITTSQDTKSNKDSLTTEYTMSSNQPTTVSSINTHLTSDYKDSTVSSDLTTFQTTTIRTCNCPCTQMGNPSLVNMTSQQLASVMEQTKRELQVNKSQLTSFIRKKISVKDDRSSSKAIGAIGIIFLVFIGMLLVGIDLLRVLGKVSQIKPYQTKNLHK